VEIGVGDVGVPDLRVRRRVEPAPVLTQICAPPFSPRHPLAYDSQLKDFRYHASIIALLVGESRAPTVCRSQGCCKTLQ
jgi:hypothetical protein